MKITVETIINFLAKHGLTIMGAFCFITLAISGTWLMLEGIDLLAGRFTSSLTPSQMYGFTVIGLGLIMVLIGERAYRLLSSASRYVKEKQFKAKENKTN